MAVHFFKGKEGRGRGRVKMYFLSTFTHSEGNDGDMETVVSDKRVTWWKSGCGVISVITGAITVIILPVSFDLLHLSFPLLSYCRSCLVKMRVINASSKNPALHLYFPLLSFCTIIVTTHVITVIIMPLQFHLISFSFPLLRVNL